jgi:hypothetical protein
MDALRQKWLARFQKVLPTRLAVRAMQIDRRLSLAAQMELAGSIPWFTEAARSGSGSRWVVESLRC